MYYFDCYEPGLQLKDDEGVHLPDIDEARSFAIKGIRCMLAAQLRDGCLDLTGSVSIRDASGARVLTIPYTEAVHVHV